MTFGDFIAGQTNRDDVVGLFARVVSADPERPQPDAHFTIWKQFLKDRDCADIGVFTGLHLAWREWQALVVAPG